MKRILFVFVSVLFLVALMAVPSSPILAAADAVCESNPPSGTVGTVFVITCSGFSPNVHVFAYLVEPDGAAGELFTSTGSLLTDSSGTITYGQPSKYPDVALAYGTWSFVAEELGLAKSVVHRGEVTFTITGGTEDVSGASLSADPSSVYKAEKSYTVYDIGFGNVNVENRSDPVVISGSGFAPWEMVTFWEEAPNGDCSSMTDHVHFRADFSDPPDYDHTTIVDSAPYYDGFSVYEVITVKANGAGDVSFVYTFGPRSCEGTWKVVGRGNASGRGAYTWVTVYGNPVTETAWLSADPSVAPALFGRVQFSGSGFGSDEPVSCWITTPQGRVVQYPFGIDELNAPGFTIKNVGIKSDAGGNIGFELVTGSEYVKVDTTSTLQDDLHREFFFPQASEGAFGEYAMSCRGDLSGATAVARFILGGGFVDP